MRALIVGEAPARTTVGRPAFHGPTGRKIAALAGIADVRDGFDAVNLLDRWPGPSVGKGSAFPLDRARAAAESLLPRVLSRSRVLLAGRRVASAFRLGGLEYLSWARLGPSTEVAVLPHPSGVNRWLNEPENVEALRRFLRDARA